MRKIALSTLVLAISGAFTTCGLVGVAAIFLDREQVVVGAPILAAAIILVLMLLAKFTRANKADLERFVRTRDASVLRRVIASPTRRNTRE
jgi:hypothetical protein